jgi:ComF family protein
MMKELLAQYKYRGNERLRGLMGHMLLHAYALHQAAVPDPNAVQVITYVPLSGERLLERGFNQAQQMAEDLGIAVKLPVIPLINRTKHTGKQSFKSRDGRLEDLQDVFAVDPTYASRLHKISRDQQIHLLIVDDVYTTGSTLNQCAKAVTSVLNVKVFGICWSR